MPEQRANIPVAISQRELGPKREGVNRKFKIATIKVMMLQTNALLLLGMTALSHLPITSI